MTQKPTLVVLAAGMGSRFGGLKQLQPLGPSGETLLEYAISDALRAGFGRVVLVIRAELAGAFTRSLVPKLTPHILVNLVHQELGSIPSGIPLPAGRAKPWGTGHAVWCAARMVQEPFVVINGDDFYGRKSFEMAIAFLREPARPEPWGLVGFRLENTLSPFGFVSRGICEVGPDSWLKEVRERTHIARESGQILFEEGKQKFSLNPSAVTSMNMWAFTPEVFPAFDLSFRKFLKEQGQSPEAEFFLPAVVNDLTQGNPGIVRVMVSPEKWFGLTYPEDKAEVQAALRHLVQSGQYPENLWGIYKNGLS